METPNYYAVIPAFVRYADISASAKLLYGEITALTTKTGYCYASNGYFANLYGTDERTIRRWKKELLDNSFIFGEFDSNTTRLFVVEMDKNVRGGGQKCPGGADKNVRHNNTRYNNTENIFFYSGENDNSTMEEKKEKNFSDLINSIEELRLFLNRGKLQEDFFYKIGDDDGWEKSTSDFFLYFETNGKIMKKKSAELLFRKWLKPKYETEKDRQDMITAYNQKNKNRRYEEENSIEMIQEEQNRKRLEDEFERLDDEKKSLLIQKALDSFKGTPLDKLAEKRKMSLAKIKAIGQLRHMHLE